jgi:MoaA/NifB/PqqE/SkfB family radical SAM enzyme
MITHPHTQSLWNGKTLLPEKVLRNGELNWREMITGQTCLKSKPRRITFGLSSKCNLGCRMCVCSQQANAGSNLGLKTVRYFEPVLEYVTEVQFVGYGEATMDTEFADILKYLNGFGAQKYLISNGKKLGELTPFFFEYRMDMLGVSVNGASQKTNQYWRPGSDLGQILRDLLFIGEYKGCHNLTYPWTTLIMTISSSNIAELPELVDLAHEARVNRVKAVYLTAFSPGMVRESLWGRQDEVRKVFREAETRASLYGIELCLPYIQGSDPGEDKPHKA